MSDKLEKILKKVEDATERLEQIPQSMEKLEQKMQSLNTDTPKNKIIIWSVACVIAAIIILLRD
jgi:t-SNARE complex subunit (syntaxin)